MNDNGNYRSLSQKALKLMRLTSTISMLILVMIPSFIACVTIRADKPIVTGLIIMSCAAAFSAAYVLIAPGIRYRRYKYLIASDRIEVIEGLVFIRRTIVPIDRIYQIDIKAGPLDNAVGVAKVMITTAGSFASLRFLEPEVADEIGMYINETVIKKLKVKGARDNV
ncbi:MAG: PH domain-containing protein [Clostridiales bacterium]|jgi:membrane protein YdbS with pleckstrin-like domain|nr:PH domain-containing protein [Clostridiales bacterium]